MNIKAEITKRNRIWKKSTPAQRRVLIARDALAQIKAKKIEITEGIYIRWDGVNESENPQECLLDNQLNCTACAKGALFISKVRIANKADFYAFGAFAGGSEEMPDWPEENWHLIEAAFEQSDVLTPERVEDLIDQEDELTKAEEREVSAWEALLYKAIRFGLRFGNSRNRLVAILENIIKNKGTFKP